jgi:hypothetical protein
VTATAVDDVAIRARSFARATAGPHAMCSRYGPRCYWGPITQTCSSSSLDQALEEL